MLVFLSSVAWPTVIGAKERGPDLLKAAYIEKFTRFAEWPDASTVNEPDEPFVLCVAGPDPFHTALDELVKITPVKDKRAVVLYQIDETQVGRCNLLFVPASKSSQLESILEHTRGRPILTVGDTPGYAERGIIINLFGQGDRLRFEVNVDALHASGLTLSSRLLQLARVLGAKAP